MGGSAAGGPALTSRTPIAIDCCLKIEKGAPHGAPFFVSATLGTIAIS
jgi:hypothetical protein